MGKEEGTDKILGDVGEIRFKIKTLPKNVTYEILSETTELRVSTRVNIYFTLLANHFQRPHESNQLFFYALISDWRDPCRTAEHYHRKTR